MTALKATSGANGSSDEASALAHKLASARTAMIAEFEAHHGLSPEEAVARVREFDQPEFAQCLLRQPLRATTWQSLDQLAASDASLAIERWNSLVEDAAGEVQSGHHAAAVVEAAGASCWERAQFLAIREQMASDWAPQTGVEWTLIDAMCQALVMKMFWLKRMVAIDAVEASVCRPNQLEPPKIDAFKWIDQAASMVDRFDRIFMRALRQLRDLRRHLPTVVVQNAHQVNVAEHQLNVADGRKSD